MKRDLEIDSNTKQNFCTLETRTDMGTPRIVYVFTYLTALFLTS